MFLIQKIVGRFSEYPLKKQMLVLFLPITLLVVWIIGIFAYDELSSQVRQFVKKNLNGRFPAQTLTRSGVDEK